MQGNEGMAGMEDVLVDDPETEEALAEFDFLVSDDGAGEARTMGDGTEWLGEFGVNGCLVALR